MLIPCITTMKHMAIATLGVSCRIVVVLHHFPTETPSSHDSSEDQSRVTLPFSLPGTVSGRGMVAISSFDKTQMVAFSMGCSEEPAFTACDHVSMSIFKEMTVRDTGYYSH